ncbi:girdin-like [Gouania willdenowi]|uniref:girdin-like n=1 Tax=Gouania willdenowi TaxID=441366 RepID=UPI0010568898|nr:girdin-like [Gouania willdenowi]
MGETSDSEYESHTSEVSHSEEDGDTTSTRSTTSTSTQKIARENACEEVKKQEDKLLKALNPETKPINFAANGTSTEEKLPIRKSKMAALRVKSKNPFKGCLNLIKRKSKIKVAQNNEHEQELQESQQDESEATNSAQSSRTTDTENSAESSQTTDTENSAESSLQNKVERLTAKLYVKEQTCHDLEDIKFILEDKLSKMTAAKNSAESSLKNQIERLSAKLHVKEQTCHDLEDTKVMLEDKLSKMTDAKNSADSSLQNKVVSLTAELHVKMQTCHDLEDVKKMLEDKLSKKTEALERSLTNERAVTSRLKEVVERSEVNSTENKTLKEHLAQQQKENNHLEKEIERLSQQNCCLQVDNNTKCNAVSSLEKLNKELTSKLEHAKTNKKLESAEKKMLEEKLELALQSHEGVISSKDTVIETLENDLKKELSNIDTAQQKLAEVTLKNQELKLCLETTLDENRNLKKQQELNEENINKMQTLEMFHEGLKIHNIRLQREFELVRLDLQRALEKQIEECNDLKDVINRERDQFSKACKHIGDLEIELYEKSEALEKSLANEKSLSSKLQIEKQRAEDLVLELQREKEKLQKSESICCVDMVKMKEDLISQNAKTIGRLQHNVFVLEEEKVASMLQVAKLKGALHRLNGEDYYSTNLRKW